MENKLIINTLFIYNIGMECKICGIPIGKYTKYQECKSCVNKRRKGSRNKGGWHHTEKHKKYMSKIMKGRIVSEETKVKISGENHYRWRGNDVGYNALHTWIRKNYGKPSYCEECKTTDKRRKYEWANISGEYKRDIKDFKRLCSSCHKKFDNIIRNINGY